VNSFSFLLLLVILMATLEFTLTSSETDNLGGPIMGLLMILAVLLSVGLVGGKGRDRSDR
jgi:hypothetical protein